MTLLHCIPCHNRESRLMPAAAPASLRTCGAITTRACPSATSRTYSGYSTVCVLLPYSYCPPCACCCSAAGITIILRKDEALQVHRGHRHRERLRVRRLPLACLACGGRSSPGSNRVPMSSHDSILAAQVPPPRQPEHRPAAAGSATGRLGHLDEPRRPVRLSDVRGEAAPVHLGGGARVVQAAGADREPGGLVRRRHLHELDDGAREGVGE